MLTDKTKKSILELQKRYPKKRSALLPALHLAQAEKGYISTETEEELSSLFDLKPNEVHAVVTFYDMFFEKPQGKHIIRLCKNVCCMLRGSDELLEKICSKLDVEPGGTTADGEFTVIPYECLAACDRAPMMLVDDQVIGPVNEDQLDEIIAKARKGGGHCSPVSAEEVYDG